MKITDIKQQQKRSARYSVYVDGKYSFSLTDWQLKQSGLQPNQTISRSEINNYKKDSDTGKLHDKALMWLSLRPRSEWEIDEYLKRKTSDVEVREDIKQKIANLGQVNDLRFAQSWVASRRSLKNVSKYRLRQELLQKRVPDTVIGQVIAEDEQTDLQTLIDLITKKQRQTRYQDQEKLLAYLARQGFKYDDIKQALKQLAEM